MLNVTVNRRELLKSIQIVENSVFDNKIRPILSGILLEAKNNKLYLKGTDLELTILSALEASLQSEGKVIIRYQLIEEFLKQIEDENITLIEEEGKLIIKTNSIDSEFSILNADDYPETSSLNTGVEYEFKISSILEKLEKIKIASSTSLENIAVNCVRLEIEENKLKMAASDTYRMMYIEEDLDDAQKDKDKIVVSIPLKTVEGLIRILKLTDTDTENLTLKSDGSQVYIKVNETEILTRVIDLPFPDYKNILVNAQYDKKVLLNTKDFTSVLKRVLIFVRNNYEAKNSGIFNFEGNKLLLRGVNENAKIKENVQTIKEGDDLKISLNVKFLLDFLTTLTSEVVEIKLLSSRSSVMLKEENNDKYIYLTMPLALREE